MIEKTLVFTLLLACLTVEAKQPTKMSRSGICHSPGSSHYDRTSVFESFSSINDCIESGGRLPKNYSVGSAAKTSAKVYERNKFGSGWSDFDGDCQDAR